MRFLLLGGLVIVVSAGVLLVSVLELARLRYADPSRSRRRHRSRFSLRRLRTGARDSLRHHGEPPLWAMSRDLSE